MPSVMSTAWKVFVALKHFAWVYLCSIVHVRYFLESYRTASWVCRYLIPSDDVGPRRGEGRVDLVSRSEPTDDGCSKFDEEGVVVASHFSVYK